MRRFAPPSALRAATSPSQARGGTPSFLPELVSGRGITRRVVEGQSRHTSDHNPPNDSIEVIQNLTRRNAHRGNPCPGKPRIPHRIARRPIAHPVPFTIDLDSQPRIGTIEIQHVHTARMLAAEFQPAWPCAQSAPEQSFGQRHFPTQLARPFHRAGLRFRRDVFQHTPCPFEFIPPRARLGEGDHPQGGGGAIAPRKTFDFGSTLLAPPSALRAAPSPRQARGGI